MISELPEIKIVRHVNAKRLRLRVEPHSIRLTVPTFCTSKQIQTFLAQSQDWLEKTWQQQSVMQASHEEQQINDLIFFNQKKYLVSIRQQQKNYVFNHLQQQLILNENLGSAALKDAVFSYAKKFLPDYLHEVSQEIGLPYLACAIRRPKTRWGSCTSQHDIMLHAGLVLMPLNIVRYVCVHELAHTRHFNHSAEFWNEVQKHDPDYLMHRKTLKSFQLPRWWYI